MTHQIDIVAISGRVLAELRAHPRLVPAGTFTGSTLVLTAQVEVSVTTSGVTVTVEVQPRTRGGAPNQRHQPTKIHGFGEHVGEATRKLIDSLDHWAEVICPD